LDTHPASCTHAVTPHFFPNTHLGVKGTVALSVDVPKLCTAAQRQKQGAKEAVSERFDTEAYNLALDMLSVY